MGLIGPRTVNIQHYNKSFNATFVDKFWISKAMAYDFTLHLLYYMTTIERAL